MVSPIFEAGSDTYQQLVQLRDITSVLVLYPIQFVCPAQHANAPLFVSATIVGVKVITLSFWS